MDLKNQNILFFTRTMQLGGTENVVLQLCEIFKGCVNDIVVCSCGGVNVEKLKEMGIKHYTIPDIEKKSPIVLLKTIKILKKVVKKEKISVIHTHHRMAAFYVYITNLYKKCIFINTSHNTFENKKKLTMLAYSKANLITCGSMVKQNLVEYFKIPPNKITVIHNAVKPFKGPIIVDEKIKTLHDEGKFIIGNIGRLSEQKGMEYYIKAIPAVIKKHANTMFWIIGSGEEEEKLRQLVYELNIEEFVYFTGYRSDIQNLMSQLDLIVLSSLWEGLPLTPIEAFSVRKTIIATAVDGTVEVVKNQNNGLLIEPKNSNQIAEKINFICDNDNLRKKFENAALKTYIKEFSFEVYSERIKKYYESL